ncbi:MAG TPA: hypothetical protein PLY23_09435 [Alphaproteobacteria bacterium]|nr:hypothetical protein [Alphaproteobacteria bacterium]HQS94823.1 hypothetical protein [Alphaproteobacteria bacterium]
MLKYFLSLLFILSIFTHNPCSALEDQLREWSPELHEKATEAIKLLSSLTYNALSPDDEVRHPPLFKLTSPDTQKSVLLLGTCHLVGLKHFSPDVLSLINSCTHLYREISPEDNKRNPLDIHNETTFLIFNFLTWQTLHSPPFTPEEFWERLKDFKVQEPLKKLLSEFPLLKDEVNSRNLLTPLSYVACFSAVDLSPLTLGEGLLQTASMDENLLQLFQKSGKPTFGLETLFHRSFLNQVAVGLTSDPSQEDLDEILENLALYESCVLGNEALRTKSRSLRWKDKKKQALEFLTKILTYFSGKTSFSKSEIHFIALGKEFLEDETETLTRANYEESYVNCVKSYMSGAILQQELHLLPGSSDEIANAARNDIFYEGLRELLDEKNPIFFYRDGIIFQENKDKSPLTGRKKEVGIKSAPHDTKATLPLVALGFSHLTHKTGILPRCARDGIRIEIYNPALQIFEVYDQAPMTLEGEAMQYVLDAMIEANPHHYRYHQS